MKLIARLENEIREKRDTSSSPDVNIFLMPDGSDKVTTPTSSQIQQYDKEAESQFRSMIQKIANSPYMPSREQLSQLLSVLLSLLIMAYLGPVLGPNAAVVSTIFRQVLPIVMASLVNYVSDKAIDEHIDSNIANVPLAPVAPNTPFAVNAK